MKLEALPWDFRAKLLDYIKPSTRALELFPTDDLLLTLHLPAAQLAALCSPADPSGQHLSAAGVQTVFGDAPMPLPFEDASFDVIFTRRARSGLAEVKRLLKPGGFYLALQPGGRDNESLLRCLYPGAALREPAYNLENQLPLYTDQGFRVLYRHQAYPVKTLETLADLETALAEIVPIYGPPDPACVARLRQTLETGASIETRGHQFFIVVQKRK